ncbi:hypothetical protein GDO81_006347 [Engystomops pustulosus]|uniref:Uncharacterized protein n=1 Tax=Engystomops pustulosus TaxID=76066 RepID=A0AAV7CVZ2_ENGPU|nr:hypothetical protein GDO81_006347 [Engystomops pustulosus]
MEIFFTYIYQYTLHKGQPIQVIWKTWSRHPPCTLLHLYRILQFSIFLSILNHILIQVCREDIFQKTTCVKHGTTD